jgi:hypothetical protein
MATPEEKFRKIFARLDSDTPGEREAAAHLLHAELKGRTAAPRSCVDLLDALDNNVPKAIYDAAALKLGQAEQRIAELEQDNARLGKKLRVVKAVAFIQFHWRGWAALAVVVMGALGAWHWWNKTQGADERAAVDASLQHLLDVYQGWGERWGEGYSKPVVVTAAGENYWAILYGDTDTSHTDSQARPVTLRCLHLYAAPAIAESDSFREPKPFGLFGWWLKWPERAALCRLTTSTKETSNE